MAHELVDGGRLAIERKRAQLFQAFSISSCRIPLGGKSPRRTLARAALPRAGWLFLTALAAAALAIHGQSETALVIAAAGVVPALLSPRDGPAWPLAVVAPALAAFNLATAWPALAGQARRAHRRAALGATGALWTLLWEQGVSRPAVTTGMLALCGVWAVAALTLPWTRSPRWPAVEILRLALWAIALGVGTTAAARLHGPAPNGPEVLTAFAGALVAFVTSRLKTRLRGHQMRVGSRSNVVA